MKGKDNTMVDTLLQLPNSPSEPVMIAATFNIEDDPTLFNKIQKGYSQDSWCSGILTDIKHKAIDSKLDIKLHNGLLFVGSYLSIPKYLDIHEQLF